MKYLKFFEASNYTFQEKKGVYYFSDSKGNDYRVYFSGPLTSKELSNLKLSPKITYELEFLTQHDDYTYMTKTGHPFSISNFIFDDILKDFIKKNKSCERILIESLDSKRKILYLRSLKRILEDINFEIEFINFPDENDIVIAKVAKV